MATNKAATKTATSTTNSDPNMLNTKDLKSVGDLTKLGVLLGNPINSKEVGAKFECILTGKIQIREFDGRKSAYYLTKEGISIKVSANFDPSIHKEGSKFACTCRQAPITREGREVLIKYATFAD